MRVLSVMDSVEQIHADSDTTIAILEEISRRGGEVVRCHPRDLELVGDDVRLSSGESLAQFDVVLMRKDPPFDIDYYFATLLLDRARDKTLIVNDPRGLRDANEKLFIFEFPELIAPTLVARSPERIKAFMSEQGGELIVKPLDGCGGMGIFHLRADDRNTNAILESMTCVGKTLVMAQKYLPAAREGDKRILLLDGEPIGQMLRVPRADETRGNLHAGGTAVKCTLDARDREICARVAPVLKARGLVFVGLDVIGGMLTEVNVTSPMGIREINRLEGVRLEERVVDWLKAHSS